MQEVVPMRKNRAYRATSVKKISFEKIISSGPAGEVTVGLDIGKHEIFAVLRWNDGKDAAVIAELAALGKSWPWPYQHTEDQDAEMAYWVDWLDAQQSIERMWLGRLESLLARHWPEATTLLKLASVTLLEALAHYGGPTELAVDEVAAQRLADWGRAMLKAEKIERVIQSAVGTVGVRQNARDIQRMFP